MTALRSAIVAHLRRPEYTGEHRCIPCTAVNVLVAVALAATIAFLSKPAAAVVLVLSIGAIYFRGYLVPGTPWFTRTYFPDWLLRLFDKGHGVRFHGDADAETILRLGGALTKCMEGDDLCITDEFEKSWNDRIAALVDTDTARGELATILEVDPDRLSFEEYGRAFVVTMDEDRTGQWESRAAFIADVAAANELRSSYEKWEDLGVERQSSVLHTLRLFLERCPSCGGTVSLDKDVVKSCCRSVDVLAATCEYCGARLFESESSV